MKNNKGFSLVELIIVIAIMAVLVGVMAPQYIKYVEKSRISSDESNASELLDNVSTALANEEATADVPASIGGAGSIVAQLTSTGIDTSVCTYSSLKTELDGTLNASGVKVQSTKYKNSTYTVSIGYRENYGFAAIGYWN